jgi:glycosyltransferase involved in cell wall biosynthesis
MFVSNDVRNDARVLREAASLAAAGHDVTIIGRPTEVTARHGDEQRQDGFTILRVPIPGGWRIGLMFLSHPWRLRRWVLHRVLGGVRGLPSGAGELLLGLVVLVAAVPWSVVRLPFVFFNRARGRRPAPGGSTLDWLIRWRWGTLGWARNAAAAAGRADVYHGHDLSGLPAAIAAHRRYGGLVVYDSHEYFMEAGSNARRPTWAKWMFSRIERRWAREAAALVTVNRTLGDLLGRKLGLAPVVVVHNAPPRWTAPASASDPLRPATGIPAGAPIVLYHGGFTADRGLLELVDCWPMVGVGEAHLVFMGYGPLRDELSARAAAPGVRGRIHVLPAVPPDVLADWVACADVGVMPNQPRTLNERLSTPNKLFESLAVGLPVVSSDFPERRRIIMEDPDGPLGAVCDPTDPAALAAAIRSILVLDPASRQDLRARCLRAAHARWNWETESARLVALYDALAAAREAK